MPIERTYATNAAAVVFAALALAVIMPGCGSGGGETSGGSGDTEAAQLRTPTRTNLPNDEPGGPHFTRADCEGLQRFLKRQLRAAGAGGPKPLKLHFTTSDSQSQCLFINPAVTVAANLDVGTNARQRYKNRIVEAIQFSFQEPDKRPVPVKGVGNPGTEEGGAVWTTSSAQLLSVRGSREMIVSYYVGGRTDDELKQGAIAFTKAAYAKTSSAS